MEENRLDLAGFENLVQALKNSSRQVLVFGAGRGGWYVMRVLQYLRIPIKCFLDNDLAKTEKGFFGYPVCTPVHMAQSSITQEIVFPALLNPGNYPVVKRQLQVCGYEKIFYCVDVFLYLFFTKVNKRYCNEKVFYRNLAAYFRRKKVLLCSPSLSYVLTQKCTLRCRDCGAFVNYYKKPKHIDPETVINDIKTYCQAFDIVHHIALQGGEPFLHPAISEIVEEISAIENLLFIDFVTNGTVLPVDSVLRKLSELGGCIIISDYGPVSHKLDKLASNCLAYGIYCDFYRYGESDWGRQTPIFKRNRSIDENDAIFQECITHPFLCCQLMLPVP